IRKHLSFASTKKSTHIRRRYSHDVSRSQLIQENVNIDIQGSQSTLPENIQDDYDDDIDFQYNYRSEELSKNEESSEDENEEFSEDENQESLEDVNEESSEDENKESSEDENQESSEDENEEASEDENEESSEDENNEDDDKMPSYDNNNEFAPYFENFTTASLFCWLQKYNISTNAYEDLAKIIHNPQFMPTH